jgi:hypothetical protein
MSKRRLNELDNRGLTSGVCPIILGLLAYLAGEGRVCRFVMVLGKRVTASGETGSLMELSAGLPFDCRR